MINLIKIAIGLVLLTAALQTGRAYLASYQFEDAVQQAMLFAPRATDAEIVEEVVKLGRDQGLPIASENVSVRTVGADRLIDVTYTMDVAFVPGFFSRPMNFSPSTSVRLLTKSGR